MKTINTRKTIRKYSDKPVSDELLNRLLAEAMRTQTMGNLQLYSVVVTRSADMKEKLAPAHFCQPMVTQAPVVLTICADFNRTTRWAENRKATPGYDNLLSFLNAATDALLYTPKQIIDTLKLPRLVMPVATITLGWPDENPPLTDRLPLQSIIHSETYTDYTPQLIDEYYAEKEALPENEEFVRVNNKETLAQVFTDLRYTKKDNEAMSATMLDALRSQGFLD